MGSACVIGSRARNVSAACDACILCVARRCSDVKGGWIYRGRGVQRQPPIPFTQQPSPSPPPPPPSVTISMPASHNTVSTAVTSSSWVSRDLNAISNNPLCWGEIHADLMEFQGSFNRSKFHWARDSRSCPYPEAQDCQNHSADNAVHAHTKGPYLERKNDSPPSNPKRRKGKEEKHS